MVRNWNSGFQELLPGDRRVGRVVATLDRRSDLLGHLGELVDQRALLRGEHDPQDLGVFLLDPFPGLHEVLAGELGLAALGRTLAGPGDAHEGLGAEGVPLVGVLAQNLLQPLQVPPQVALGR
jgi:hypothetical protein